MLSLSLSVANLVLTCFALYKFKKLEKKINFFTKRK